MAKLMNALDPVIDENRRLAEQNQQLMAKLEEVRQHVETINPTIATPEAEKAAAQLSAAAQQEIDSFRSRASSAATMKLSSGLS
jgi:cell division septum initiation protein DivIVA